MQSFQFAAIGVLIVCVIVLIYILVRRGRQLVVAKLQLEKGQGEVATLKHKVAELGAAIAEKKNSESIFFKILDQEKDRNKALQKKIEDLERTHKLLEKDNEHIRAAQVSQRVQNETHLKVLEEQRVHLSDQFKILADKIFTEKTQSLKDVSNEHMMNILTPFKDQLGQLREQIDKRFGDEAKERHTLSAELVKLRELNTKLNAEAGNLTQALKGDNKLQGNWGELKLEKLFELAGMERGTEYEMQPTFTNKGGNTLRPDAIIHLPEKKRIVVDSKMSLTAHTQYHDAETDKRRVDALKAHMHSIKMHVNELKGKYARLEGIENLEFVLMFIPIEAAFILALQEARRSDGLNLFELALRENVMIVGPSTLIVTLKTIHHIWRVEKQQRQSREIAELGAGLYDKLAIFVDKMEKVESAIDKSQATFQDAFKTLARGKGNLLGKAHKFIELGVVPKKKIDERLVDDAMANYDSKDTLN